MLKYVYFYTKIKYIWNNCG